MWRTTGFSIVECFDTTIHNGPKQDEERLYQRPGHHWEVREMNDRRWVYGGLEIS